MKADIEAIRGLIRGMKPRSVFYRMLKEELTALGHWRNHPRGNPKKGFRVAGGKDTGKQKEEKGTHEYHDELDDRY